MPGRFWGAILGLLLACGLTASQQQENRWDEYEPRTLQSIIDSNKSDITPELNAAKKAMLITGYNFPSKVRITYLAKARPLTGKRKELFVNWTKAVKAGLPPNVIELFETEMLFQEGRKRHWVVVQKPLVEFLQKEAKVGKQVTGYVIWIGAVKVQNRWEWLFAMNEFDAPERPQ